MSTTTTSAPGSRQDPRADHPDHGKASRPPWRTPLPRQRRRSMLLLGIVLTVAGAFAVTTLVTSISHQTSVLIAARNIPAGTVVSAADLATASVSGSGISTVPARQEAMVTGRTAAVGIQSGTLLAPADLTGAPVPGRGQQLVPVPLKQSQLPASGLISGTQVLVVATPGSAGQASGGQASSQPLTTAVPATVYRVSPPDESGVSTVDLLVTATQGPAVAEQASTGQIALVVTSRDR